MNKYRYDGEMPEKSVIRLPIPMHRYRKGKAKRSEPKPASQARKAHDIVTAWSGFAVAVLLVMLAAEPSPLLGAESMFFLLLALFFVVSGLDRLRR